MSTEIKPGWNLWQYLYVFVVGFFGDAIIHFFSSRKFWALREGRDAFGIAPSLMYYYNSLKNTPPFVTWETFNSWFWGAVFGGLACLIAVVLADIIVYAQSQTK